MFHRCLYLEFSYILSSLIFVAIFYGQVVSQNYKNNNLKRTSVPCPWLALWNIVLVDKIRSLEH